MDSSYTFYCHPCPENQKMSLLDSLTNQHLYPIYQIFVHVVIDVSHHILSTPSATLLILLNIGNVFLSKRSSSTTMDVGKAVTQGEEKNSGERIKTILWYANVIIFSQSFFSYVHSTIQTSLTPIYDMNRQELDYTMKHRRLPLFLPEKTMVSGSEYVHTYTTLKDSVISESTCSSEYQVAVRNGESNDNQKNSASEIEEGWALLTGASRGIGRALAIELARWKVSTFKCFFQYHCHSKNIFLYIFEYT